MNEDECSWITGSDESAPAPWQTRVAGGGAFPNTRWSLVAGAAQDGTIASDALEILCRDYWYPLYSYIRRQGKSAADAQDLTQGFFEYLLAGNYLARAEQEKGRLRSYLLGGLKHFSAYQFRKETSLKRGGGIPRISIDEQLAEERYQYEPQADESGNPDRLFERRWAMAVLETVLQKLASEFHAGGKDDQFAILSGFLAWNSGEMTYVQAGEKLGMKEGAVKVAVHRMRNRYREILHQEILATVASPEEVEEEIDYLLGVLSR